MINLDIAVEQGLLAGCSPQRCGGAEVIEKEQ